MKRFYSPKLWLCSLVLLFSTALFAEEISYYTLTDDDVVVEDGAIISCSYDFTNTNIIIPETLDGQTVTAIEGTSPGVFQERGLTNVQLSESLTSIGNFAFYDNALASVSFPEFLTYIGTYAFRDNDLTSVSFPESLTTIEEGAFYGNDLTSVSFPESLTSIGAWAFYGNDLTNFVLPTSKKEGYTFNNWLDDLDESYEGGAVVTNFYREYTAQFTGISYDLTFLV